MKAWFITGAWRGFGRIWAEAALARGTGPIIPLGLVNSTLVLH
jgi:NAD(P)-dependent dehydrogenase (short-subunit alcohol dehydrogenase family)